MTVKGKRIFNYRPLVVFVLSLLLGIILGEAVYARPIGIIIFMCIAAFIAVIPFLCIKKVRRFTYIPIALLVGMVAITSANAVYDSRMINDYKGTFTATVSSEIIVDEGRTVFTVTDIWIDGKKLKSDANVYIPFEFVPDFGAGDVVKLSGTVMSNRHIRFNSYDSKQGYFASVNAINKVSDGTLKFPANLQMKIKRMLYENTDEYTASVCQALLLGSKRGFNSGAYDDIAVSGLAHVLAVSGLHITTLAGALYFVLKKLKVNPKISFVIVTVLTFLYSMLCGFTASSLRAVIMSAVLSFSSAFGLKQDGMSSLAFAAILILLFRPTAFMDVGFLLSFASVFGIFAFYKPFEKTALKIVNKISPKRKIGTRFAKVCALSFATNLATLGLVAYYFGRVPTLFVLSNFIVLPYMIAFFVLAIILCILSLITGFGGFIWIMKYLLYPFKAYVAAVGSLPFTSIPVAANVAMVVCFAILMLWLSKFNFVKKRTKAVGALVGGSASVAVCLLFALI